MAFDIPDEVVISDKGAIYSVFGPQDVNVDLSARIITQIELISGSGFAVIGVSCHPGCETVYMALDKFMAQKLAGGLTDLAKELL